MHLQMDEFWKLHSSTSRLQLRSVSCFRFVAARWGCEDLPVQHVSSGLDDDDDGPMANNSIVNSIDDFEVKWELARTMNMMTMMMVIRKWPWWWGQKSICLWWSYWKLMWPYWKIKQWSCSVNFCTLMKAKSTASNLPQNTLIQRQKNIRQQNTSNIQTIHMPNSYIYHPPTCASSVTSLAYKKKKHIISHTQQHFNHQPIRRHL